MIDRTISELCAEVKGRSANGRMVPSILMAVGTVVLDHFLQQILG
jgi:hypothetical protein